MNFNSLFRVCLIFLHTILRTSKASGITIHEKMLLATAGPYSDVLTDVYCSKQTGSSSTKGKPSPIISSFLELAEENCRCSQNLWRQKMLLKQKPSKHSVNGLLGFITLAFILRWKRVCAVSQLHELPIDMGNSSALLITILLGSFQLFFA